VFQGVIFDTYQWQQPLFDGTTATYEMVKRPDSVLILAVKDDKLVILEEHQAGRAPFVGIPGGRHDREEETELDAAKREVTEETGFTFKDWKLLSVKQVEPKVEHFVYFFLATNFEKAVEHKSDSGENIRVKLLDFHEVKSLIGQPTTRYVAQDIIGPAASLEELLNLPPYRP